MMETTQMSETTEVLTATVTVTPSHRNALTVALVATLAMATGCVVGMDSSQGIAEPQGSDETGTGSGSGSGSGSAMDVPTGAFAVDCAITENQMTPHCARPSSVPAGSLGLGTPIVDVGLGTLNGGFVDGMRLVAAVAYATSNTMPATGYVLAVDLATGDRKVISGSYTDPANGRMTVGTGPDWGSVNDVQPGPDGWYAITSLGVYRVDPATGTRTLVIDAANTATRCTVGTTKAIPRKDTLAIGADKSVYLALSNSPAGTGTGLVAVKAGVCKLISLGGGPTGSSVGTGATMTSGYFRSLRVRNGIVWAQEFQTKSLFRIDPATLARMRISSTGTTRLGAGDADLGIAWHAVDSTGALYTSDYDGLNRQLHLVSVDTTTGDRNEVGLDGGPANKGGETYPPLWMHPTKPWALVGLDNAIVQVDLPSGASYTLSR
jgi:hypothetical protein